MLDFKIKRTKMHGAVKKSGKMRKIIFPEKSIENGTIFNENQLKRRYFIKWEKQSHWGFKCTPL